MSTKPTKAAPDYDVIVVGARVAGAATALNLARGGARVLMIDRAMAGSDTLSTHAIMRLGVNLLDRWGVLEKLIAAGTPVIRRTRFQYGSENIEVAIKPDGSVQGLLAPRRYLLDRLLAETATDAGVEWAEGVSLEALVQQGDDRVGGAILRGKNGQQYAVTADLVVGADGRNSTVAKLVGADTQIVSEHATSAIYGYFDAPKDDAFSWYFMPRFTGGIIPTNDGQICAFISVPPNQLRSTFGADPLPALINHFGRFDATLGEQLHLNSQDVRLRRFPGAHGHMRQSFGRGWALVGDAGYFKDPATAHGITDALRDGDALARAILSGAPNPLATYQHNRDSQSHDLFHVTDQIAGLDWSLSDVLGLHGQLSKAMKAEVALDAARRFEVAA